MNGPEKVPCANQDISKRDDINAKDGPSDVLQITPERSNSPYFVYNDQRMYINAPVGNLATGDKNSGNMDTKFGQQHPDTLRQGSELKTDKNDAMATDQDKALVPNKNEALVNRTEAPPCVIDIDGDTDINGDTIDREEAIDQAAALPTEESESVVTDTDKVIKINRDSTSVIHILVTMWREEEQEMRHLVNSILAMYKDQNELNGYIIADTHIMFDDALIEDHADVKENDYVKKFVGILEECAGLDKNMSHHVSTPYGGQLVWTLLTEHTVTVHLKDCLKIRKGKRSSQALYFVLMNGMTDRSISTDLKDGTPFYLILDGDTGFSLESFRHLYKEIKANPKVGAVRGRIKVIEPVVWYQKLEYACTWYWLQKFNRYWCSPGCFNLFRGSALMKKEILEDFYKLTQIASQNNEYEFGEKSILCTLLDQHYNRVEYSHDAEAHVFAPRGHIKSFRQIHRLRYSKLRQILDMILLCRIAPNKKSICLVFTMLCSLFLLDIVPDSAFLCGCGAKYFSVPVVSYIMEGILCIGTVAEAIRICFGPFTKTTDVMQSCLTFFAFFAAFITLIKKIITNPTTVLFFYYFAAFFIINKAWLIIEGFFLVVDFCFVLLSYSGVKPPSRNKELKGQEWNKERLLNEGIPSNLSPVHQRKVDPLFNTRLTPIVVGIIAILIYFTGDMKA